MTSQIKSHNSQSMIIRSFKYIIPVFAIHFLWLHFVMKKELTLSLAAATTQSVLMGILFFASLFVIKSIFKFIK
ncbi:MAG: hypothetical protein OEY33_07205 [Bdellovibrionales bacterium]|nr:hypothetical protein [Bdellovibrionales bacterium]